MANIVLFEGNRYTGDTTSLAQYYGAQSSTNFEVLNSSGILTDSSVGINFTYGSNGFYKTGTIHSNFYFSDSGQLVTQETNLNLDVATRNSLLSLGTSAYDYYQYVLRGDDTILGSSGDDEFDGSKGNDTINGGAGIDLLNFDKFSEAVTVNLLTGHAITSYGNSVISNIEDIGGSAYSDILTGNAGDNQIQGFGGADKIEGGAGFDTAAYFDASSAINVNLATGVVSGGSGNDTLTSIERVIGSRFNDVLTGSNANEFFLGGLGNDTINGGGGVDTVEYNFVGSGVIVNLTTGLSSGGGGNDIISNIESISGSVFDDTLVGNDLDNVLDGGNGSDTFDGGKGSDILIAGGSTDQGENHLNGGMGNDVLIAGGTKTQFLNNLLTQNPDIVSSLLSDPKWGKAQSFVKSDIDNSGGGVHNVFEFHSASGNDSIYNFHAASDKIQIDSGLNGSNLRDVTSLLQHVSVSGNDLSIDFGGGNSVTLIGVDISALSVNNAFFV